MNGLWSAPPAFRTGSARAATGAAVLWCVLWFCPAAHAIPWQNQAFDLRADNEALDVFITRMLTLEGVPVRTSELLSGLRVNGRLKGRAPALFQELVQSYGLAWYHDGNAVYVYTLSEMQTRLWQGRAGDGQRITQALQQLGLHDARYPVVEVAGSGLIRVSGPPRLLELVLEVAASTAQWPGAAPTAADSQIRLFRLKHARATDTRIAVAGEEVVVPGVARLLRELVADQPPAPFSVSGTPAAGTARPPQPVGGLAFDAPALRLQRQLLPTGSSDATRPRNSAPPPNPGDDAGTPPSAPPADAPGIGLRQSLALAEAGAGLAAARISADLRTNAVIVRDHPSRMGMYADLIAQLDVETALLQIDAAVIDISEGNSQQLGIDWRLSSSRLQLSSGAGDLPLAPLPGMPAQAAAAQGPGLVSSLLLGTQRTSLLARVQALAERGNARLVSMPNILTLDNHEAVLQSSREFFVRVAGREAAELFTVNVGLVLRVTPSLIGGEDQRRIRLQVRIEDGNTATGAQVDQIPVVSRNAIATQAVIGDGQSLLVAGHIIDESQGGRSGIPWLSEVSGIGRLFGREARSQRRVERLYLITPRLISINEAASTLAATP
jgi:type III secretion protein C